MCRGNILLYVRGGRVNLCAHKEERVINVHPLIKWWDQKSLDGIIVHA